MRYYHYSKGEMLLEEAARCLKRAKKTTDREQAYRWIEAGAINLAWANGYEEGAHP